MSDSSRYYENNLADLSLTDSPLWDTTTRKLSSGVVAELDRIHQRLLTVLEKNLNKSKSDVSVYTGTAGIAYLYLTLSEKDNSSAFLQKASQLAEQSLQRLRRRDITFLCGDTGPLCIAAVIRHRCGEVDGARECVTVVLDFLQRVLDLQSDLPDELLYGRVGYLYSLLFLKKNIPGSIPSGALKQVANAILTQGKSNDTPPLMWTWHKKKYLGGAHGLAGILYILLQVKELLSEDQLTHVRSTVDFLLSIRYPSGNFPSSIGSRDDRLVHWCHGAPGVVQLLLAAYKTWGSETYLQAAEQCGEIVWQRGLLKKGYGICHGVAGNAYTFIALFQVTKSEKHLHRAVQFARWCGSYDCNQEKPPDRPFSLFEGLAGTVYFLKDIHDPANALFPGFTIQPF